MPSEQEFFDTYADVYDELLGSQPDIGEIVEMFASTPDTSILEFGSGTGRLAIPLAVRGLHVTVIELSARMIDVMRRKADVGLIHIHHGDFTSCSIDRQFDAVIMSRNTLYSVAEQDLQLAAIRNAARHLSAGGRLYVDLGFPRPDSSSDLQLGGMVGDSIVLYQRHHDPVSQRISFNRVFIGGDAALVRTTARYIWPSELDLMAQLAGLVLADRWSDWRGTPFRYGAAASVSVYQNG